MSEVQAADYLFVVNLDNVFDLDVDEGIVEPSWDDFKEDLLRHRLRRSKDGECFMPVAMKPDNECVTVYTKDGTPHFKADINIESVTALVIDLDKIGALQYAEDLFKGYEYVCYSTHNFSVETPWKYRMVVRLAEPIPVEQWPTCFEVLLAQNIDMDQSCRNPSRMYYYPSHNPDGGVAPRAWHKPGKAMSIDNILGLASDDVKNAIKEGRFASKLKINPNGVGQSTRRRHFSGDVIGAHDVLPDVIDCSFQRFEDTHGQSIYAFGTDGSYHNLARDCAGREMRLYGHKADIRKLVIFLAQIGLRDCNRPIEAGNTPEELPGLIITALMKYAPESFHMLNEIHGQNLEAWVTGEVRWGMTTYREASLEVKQAPQELDVTVEQNYYASLRTRHIKALKSFSTTGNFSDLVREIVNQELKIEIPAYSDVAHALFTFHTGYNRKVKGIDEKTALAYFAEDIPKLCDQLPKMGLSVDEKKLRFMAGALRVQLAQKVPAQLRQPKQADQSVAMSR
ncbi:hypothetical protein HNP46_000166 [Pseudomonas nitritireducens]|uniref:DNA primase n=1 Tax=Pseudomonas nitroreducens TaxID=46680 RepID=A0A7W7KEG2_PSENT|nr:hypothetical protein [Pseudomonas nitritireducens]MBB4861355.1 hypothetical protein [Pseudomonas nitritireducens]